MPAEAALVERCGAALPGVLQGAIDPLDVLFPDGRFDALTDLYERSPVSRAANGLIGALVGRLIDHTPDRPLRILEIGAGTGSTTRAVIPHLDPSRVEYVFTDLGGLFVSRARERHTSVPSLRFATLDIEHPPSAQGFADHQLDVVIAANVLHATRDLAETLAHAKALLAPGGLLVVLEGVRPKCWVDLVFGMTEGWWRFEDHQRRSHPLIGSTQWSAELAAAGFSTSAALNPADARWGDLAVIVAQAPAAQAAVESDLPARPPVRDRVLILADDTGVADALQAHCATHDRPCTLIRAGAGGQLSSRTDHAGLEHLLRARLADPQRPYTKVVHLWGADADGEDPPKAQASLLGSALTLVRAVADLPAPPRLWLVSRGSHDVGGRLDPGGLAASTLWGLGRVLREERAELWGGAIDLDPAAEATACGKQILIEMGKHDAAAEDQVALRGPDRFVARLRPVPIDPTAAAPSVAGDGTYLITGGTRGLGLAVASWLAGRGARHLVLASRRPPPPASSSAIEALRTAGATVHTEVLDVTDRAAVQALVDRISSSPYPLRGVVHSAGRLADGLLPSTTWSRFTEVLGPKVDGAWNLHLALGETPLDFFLLFSSTAALLGSAGQGNHAAANAFLDALAEHRRHAGLPASSVAWGAWSSIGSAASPAVAARLAKKGVDTIAPQQGLAAFEHALASDRRYLAVVPVRWPDYLAAQGAKPLLAQIAQQQGHHQAERPALAALLDAAEPADRRDLLSAHIEATVAQILGVDQALGIDRQRGFVDLGFDSLMSIELKNALSRSLGRELAPTVALNYPTIDALTAHLIPQAPSEVDKPAPTSAAVHRVIDDVDEMSDAEALQALLGTRDD